MSVISQQRCFNHAEREAVARCPGCGACFCRECVTEHDDRVICAGCLAKQTRQALLKRAGFAQVANAGQVLLGILLAWFFFQLIGEMLLAMPAKFHEGTVWQDKWFDTE